MSASGFFSYPSATKLVARLVAGVCFIWIMGQAVPAAQADPHAMFYTTIGQQQLFFNVLAALDQADYVESKQLRDELLGKREVTGFLPEPKDTTIGTTRTDLASVLTRSVTLEGDDLWTAYLANQFALEAARRRGVDEVLRIYCERGLGVENCEKNKDGKLDVKKIEEDQKKAFDVNDPVRVAEPAIRGLAALDSGTDQVRRQEIVDLKTGDPGRRPYPYDPYIAELNQRTGQNPDKALAVDRLIAAAKGVYSPDTITPTIFDDIDIDQNTKQATLPRQENEDSTTYLTRYMQKVTDFIGLPNTFLATADRGVSAVADFQAREEVDGALADTDIRHPEDEEGNFTYISGTINVPAHVKVAAAGEALNAIANTEQNLKFEPSVGESELGTQQLVERPEVAGISTESELDPRVLHSSTLDGNTPAHDDNLKSLTPAVNPTSFHHEQGPIHFLKTIGYKADRGGCGCQGAVNGTANEYGQKILRRIRELHT